MGLYRDSVAVLRAPLIPGPYGDVRDWVNARTVYTALRASVQPVISSREGLATDLDQDRETGITTYRVYTPSQADIRVSDRARYGGQLYEVSGVSLIWPVITGRNSYTLATIRRVDG
ncbi:head-tail adaptor protein [Nonomuraea sp. B19D2]|uniref:phage head completion protein n=1 Tax=Nonomuraea sp. B19D2 TaxID=3159561 RepID=UPI0032D9BAEB